MKCLRSRVSNLLLLNQMEVQVNKKKKDPSSAIVGAIQKKKKDKMRCYIDSQEFTI